VRSRKVHLFGAGQLKVEHITALIIQQSLRHTGGQNLGRGEDIASLYNFERAKHLAKRVTDAVGDPFSKVDTKAVTDIAGFKTNEFHCARASHLERSIGANVPSAARA
jgi:hypothetical protein